MSGFEPLTVRLQGGLAGPHLSTAGHLSRALDGLATPGVQAHRLVSVVVVSAALAARRLPGLRQRLGWVSSMKLDNSRV